MNKKASTKQHCDEIVPSPAVIHQQYDRYRQGKMIGVFTFGLSFIIFALSCPQFLFGVENDMIGFFLVILFTLLFFLIFGIIGFKMSYKAKKVYGKYFTDEIKSAYKNYERFIKSIIIITSIIGSIIMAIVLIPILSDSKTSDNNYDNTCALCGENDATIGEYCRGCYKTLDNIRDAYE